MSRRMRLLMLIGDLGRSGTPVHLYELLRRLDSGRFDIEVCCLDKSGELVPLVEELGIPVHDLKLPIIYKPGFLRGFLRLRKMIRQRPPDLVHTFLFISDTFGAMIARWGGAHRVVTSRRMMVTDDAPRRVALYRMTNRWVDRIVTPSLAARNACIEAEGVAPDRVVTVYNGIDLDRIRSAADCEDFPSGQGPWIGTVGHLKRLKGQQTLINAFSGIREQFPGAGLVIVGDGPHRPALEARAAELGGGVHFLGARNDVPAVLSRLDLFVLPSDSEGMSNALLEAMGAGCAAVATKVGGNPEVLQHGVQGLLVPPGRPGPMAEACLSLLKDPELRARMGRAGEKRVAERFTVDRMAAQMGDLYESLTNGARHREPPARRTR